MMRLTPVLYTIEGNELLSRVLSISGRLISVACWIAVIAYPILALILVLRRYYKNFFTDEGYLTFTLPVKANTHLMSKFLSGYIWMVIAAIITFISLGILILCGTAGKGLFNQKILDWIKDLFDWSNFTSKEIGIVVRLIIEFALMVITTAAYSLLLMYLAITLGSIIAKKHKLLASIGMYYAINIAVGLIMNVFSVILVSRVRDDQYYLTSYYGLSYIESTLWTLVALFTVFAVAAYLVNRHLLKNKLNLN